LMLAALRLSDRVTGSAAHTAVRIALTMIAPIGLLIAFVVVAAKEQVPRSDANLDAHQVGRE
jgi:hypothetical protein